jgi:hypothetical protein
VNTETLLTVIGLAAAFGAWMFDVGRKLGNLVSRLESYHAIGQQQREDHARMADRVEKLSPAVRENRRRIVETQSEVSDHGHRLDHHEQWLLSLDPNRPPAA